MRIILNSHAEITKVKGNTPKPPSLVTSQLWWLLPALDILEVPPECLFSPASYESLILPNNPLPFIYNYTLTLFLKLGFDFSYKPH